MTFYIRDPDGSFVRRRVQIDFTDEPLLTEQAHAAEVDINNIISRHGADIFARQYTQMLQSGAFRFDDVTGNDFQEASRIIAKAQQSFDNLPSKVRAKFDNDPAVFLDYVQNPDNQSSLIEMGLAVPPVPEPVVRVEVTNPPPAPSSDE